MALAANVHKIAPHAYAKPWPQVIFIDQHGHEVAHNPSKLEVKHVAPEDK